MVKMTPADRQPGGALNRVEAVLQAQFRSGDSFVGRLFAQAVLGRGKRLRARLVLLAAGVLGGHGSRVERLAAVFELLHHATLVHDDVIDESRRRRHRFTLNARFGNTAAVLAGDLLFVRAIRLLEDGRYPAAVRGALIRAAAAVCLGELQELRHQRDLGMTPAEYFVVVGNKTASLLGAACECGALLAGGSAARVAALARYGREFGIAFQIQDDLLDLTGGSRRLGKPVGQDLEAGRMTLPCILGLQRSRGGERRRLLSLLRDLDRRGLVRALASGGALDLAQQAAREHARQARAALRALPPSPARQALEDLADFAVERKY